MDGAVVQLEADDAAAAAFGVHDQVDGEIFDEEFGRIFQRLTIERVQHGVAGAVGGGAGALGRRAAPVIGGHAAEGALIDLAFRGAREGNAPMLQLIDGGRGVAAQIFDGVLVSEPIGALDGVVHVPFPVVRPHVGERGGHAALRRHRMRTGGEDLGNAGRAEARLGTADGGAQTRAARADHHHVERVVNDRIGLAADGRCGRGVVGCHWINPCEWEDNPAGAPSGARAPWKTQVKLRRSTAKIEATPIRALKLKLAISAKALACSE